MRQREPALARPSLIYGLALGTLIATTLSYLAGRLPIIVPVGYWALSVVSVIAYGFDKAEARRGGQRLSENSLHLIAVLGGWPGALIAQQWFRHKTQKRSFRIVFWATAAINIAVVIWLLATGSAVSPVRP